MRKMSQKQPRTGQRAAPELKRQKMRLDSYSTGSDDGKIEEGSILAPETTTQDIDLSTDITALNSIMSPLLSLPAELRNEIWRYTYGDNRIMVSNYRPVFKWHMRWGLSKEPERITSGRYVVLLVSKQFWAETYSILMSTCTFCFFDAADFGEFAKSYRFQAMRRYVQKIYLDVKCLRASEDYSEHSFESLKEFSLSFWIDYWIDMPPYNPTPANIMRNKRWTEMGMASFIRVFRQYPMEGVRVEVQFQFLRTQWLPTELKATEEQIERIILEQKPLRRSERMKATRQSN